MTKKLHTKLFLPVFLVLLAFPIFIWTTFSATARQYFQQLAERNTNRLVQQTRSAIRQFDPGVSGSNRLSLAEYLVGQLDGSGGNGITAQNGKTSILMISTDFSLTYPEPVSAPENIQNLYETCRQMLQSNTLPAKESLPLNSSGSIFVVQMLESPSSQPDPAKYILCYSSVPNPSSFLSSAWKLLCGITIFFLLAASILIWIITKGITRPLDLLCRKAKEIGDGNYTPITDDFRAEELENLKRSINCMAENLKKSEESTVAFFQNASHDLKTPLAAISGYAEGIQCGIWEDPKKPAGIILNESLRMSRLVESILTISKLDNKTLDLQIVLIELDEFLYEQILLLQGSCKEKALTAAEPFPSICVMADGALLTRIVQNLVSNCLRYASHEVVIRLIQRGNTAEIIIEDDGPGIPEEKLSQVFQRLYTGEQGGFGLGLSIVKSGIEYMNGTVSVENKGAPQHGVICRLRMPVSEKFLS